ncbi:kinase-like domain-containing protein, partial [Phaeosphaeriaceae sp. PMI808]
IGHGVAGVIDQVVSSVTGEVYARKTLGVATSRQRREAQLKAFNNEIKVLRSLRHKHIIQYVGSYRHHRHLAIIMSPVADMGDMSRFLEDMKDTRDSVDEIPTLTQRISLENWFGCLASGLAFMHHQRIRHRDIKPSNILIHRGSVIFTDFGVSHDFNELDTTSTEGPVTGFTRRYCAPEVLNHGKRGISADIYSLGCVFLEVLAALDQNVA